MGIALSTDTYDDPEEVLRDASRALRKAKGEGSGSIQIFSSAQHEAVSAQVELEERIRRALERDEMVLHYQPILSLTDGRIVGLEALIRWPTSEGGFIPAGDFIPIAERSGLVAHLGWWTLERACHQTLEWHRQFPGPFPVAVMVNVPGRSFSGPELVPSVIRILEQTGFPPEFLHLEITETSAMTDVERSLETLHALKAVGVHLHVDDFGTGHSSLSYLHRFPVDSLKVDRSFVAEMTDGPENMAIVKTVVDLARSLRLSVVAEGVETTAQLERLRELRCDYVQGWLFAKAMDPAQVSITLKDPGTILRGLIPAGPS
jgi:EAL domain-containing protein (putative c-di-GMP-specific phosphodiesterase class I)